MHITTEITEPEAVARPMGSRVSGNSLDVMYTPGTRISPMAMMLCMKDRPDLPMAQKYPLKQKCTPANMQSHT